MKRFATLVMTVMMVQMKLRDLVLKVFSFFERVMTIFEVMIPYFVNQFQTRMLRFFSLDICKNSGRWKCPNENKCFNHDLVCDSKDDCKDGADETEKVCNEACPLKGELACIQNGNICLNGIPLILKLFYTQTMN